MTPRRPCLRGVVAFGVSARLDHRSAAKQVLDELTIRSLDSNRKMAVGIASVAPLFNSGRPVMWVLLLVPFIGLLWVPFYNFEVPELFGFPFFYWYQFAWVPICSILIWLVHRSQTPDETP